jgi:hypothetical protein
LPFSFNLPRPTKSSKSSSNVGLQVRGTTALRCAGESAKLGLRTLEFWIDQLPSEALDRVAACPADWASLLLAVCSHLRPSPYPYGTHAIRILGKLGGRNRTFLRELMAMPGTVEGEDDAPALPTAALVLESVQSTYVSSVAYALGSQSAAGPTGIITVTGNTDTNLNGKTLALTATYDTSNGQLTWVCTAGSTNGIAAKFLPASCKSSS